jgi:hypothetical protein
MIEGISAITLGTHEMERAVRFYRALGFEVLYGDEESSFTSLRGGVSCLNLITQPAERRWSWRGRVIVYVGDVDALYDRALARDTCACRKSNPYISMMQPAAQHRPTTDAPCPLNSARYWRILLQG